MHIDRRLGLLRYCAAISTLAAGAAVGSTAQAGTTVLFEQPLKSGIANNVYVAHVDKGGLPTGTFDMVVEQSDPDTAKGNLVVTAWDAGSQTGFTPTSPSTAQLGFRNQAGTTTAQMEGGTVGAYINSKDLPTTLTAQKMMITPQYRFAAGASPVPFASSTSVLNAELDVQIPVAMGSDTYVTADFLFLDPDGTRFSYGVKIFHNGATHNLTLVGSGYDELDNVYIINCPLDTDTEFLTRASTSESSTGTPWLGWRHFQWTINEAQFSAGLKFLAAHNPGKVKYSDPTKYVFSEVHLNSEFHYSPAPAELGWSMKGLQVWLTD